MKLQPENLLAAGEAPSYQAMMRVLASGRPTAAVALTPNDKSPVPLVLGDFTDDLVYTPINPCRILDTRFASLGAIATNQVRAVDVDGGSYTSQGGISTSCGIPFGVPTAVAITLTVTGPIAPGYLTAYSLCATQPTASTINYTTGQTIATGAIVPICPGAGADMNIYAFQGTQAIVDVVGYYASPVATPADCTQVSTAFAFAPSSSVYGVWDNSCPTGRTLTGGGYLTTNLVLSQAIFTAWESGPQNATTWRVYLSNQTNQTINGTTYAICCRVPGR